MPAAGHQLSARACSTRGCTKHGMHGTLALMVKQPASGCAHLASNPEFPTKGEHARGQLLSCMGAPCPGLQPAFSGSARYERGSCSTPRAARRAADRRRPAARAASAARQLSIAQAHAGWAPARALATFSLMPARSRSGTRRLGAAQALAIFSLPLARPRSGTGPAPQSARAGGPGTRRGRPSPSRTPARSGAARA